MQNQMYIRKIMLIFVTSSFIYSHVELREDLSTKNKDRTWMHTTIMRAIPKGITFPLIHVSIASKHPIWKMRWDDESSYNLTFEIANKYFQKIYEWFSAMTIEYLPLVFCDHRLCSKFACDRHPLYKAWYSTKMELHLLRENKSSPMQNTGLLFGNKY